MMSNISIKLTQSTKTIENKIKKAIADEMNNLIRRRRARLLGARKKAVDGWVSSSAFIVHLASGGVGSIAAEFGLLAGSESIVANSIKSAIAESTKIEFGKFTKTLKGGLEIRFQPSTFVNLLSLPEGFTTINNGKLHWMDWLINRGDEVLVFDYTFQPGLEGRSGGGVMLGGGSYRINPKYSGTQDNNVFTDMFKNREQQIANILQSELFA